ncbi:kanadaptin isoform X1 [Callorhinchus milii]|uniref:kanadaptin isoform X1 n=1 Tax=Callorhinchus milii TaxID=7868 RepID=UPI001C3F82A1|nr:kanadaptin isoform X1 [Callorhinchus milii]
MAEDSENGEGFKKPLLPLVASQKKAKSQSSISSAVSSELSEKVRIVDERSKKVTATSSESSMGHLSSDEVPMSEDMPATDQKLIEKPYLTLPKKPKSIPRLPSDKYKPCAPLPYVEPPWGGLPESPYSFEILKTGSIVSELRLNSKSFHVVGRLPNCDISLEHPSISRYHAIVQHRRVADGETGVGFYIYDLESTHGTVVNKVKIQPKTYHRLKVGHVIKFGGSTRLLVLQGPEYDQDTESDLTVTELKQLNRQHERLERRMLGDDGDDDDDDDDDDDEEEEASVPKKQPKPPGPKPETGCSWGMDEDAVEDESEENPYAIEFQEDQEAFYIKDPKKSLQGFFDREGEELEYEYEEQGSGTWICRVRLPVDDALGKQLVAEVTHSGKKKEAMIQCSLDACRILDARGVLRQEAVSRKRKSKNWEDDDFYDSDEDTFLDRTGVIEKKRLNRMKKAGKVEEKPETYKSLVAKLAQVEEELVDVESKLRVSGKAHVQSPAEDSLDAFMTEIRAGAALDNVTRKKLHLRSFELKKEQQKLQKLINFVTPTALPGLRTGDIGLSTQLESKPKKITLPLFGAMKGGKKFKLKTGALGNLPPKRPELPSGLFNMRSTNTEEEEEEEEEVNNTPSLETEPHTSLSQSFDPPESSNQADGSTSLPQCSGVESDQDPTILSTEDQEVVNDSLSKEEPTEVKTSKDGKPEGKRLKKKMYGPSKVKQEMVEHTSMISTDTEDLTQSIARASTLPGWEMVGWGGLKMFAVPFFKPTKLQVQVQVLHCL